jgi:MtN3 and saliva related transmembrane protein
MMHLILSLPAQWVELIGYFGSFLTSITFIPQVYKSWKSKSVGDLSIWMVLIVITSTIVWLVYGFAIQSGPVILANSIVFILTLVLLGFKLSFPTHNSKGQ